MRTPRREGVRGPRRRGRRRAPYSFSLHRITLNLLLDAKEAGASVRPPTVVRAQGTRSGYLGNRSYGNMAPQSAYRIPLRVFPNAMRGANPIGRERRRVCEPSSFVSSQTTGRKCSSEVCNETSSHGFSHAEAGTTGNVPPPR